MFFAVRYQVLGRLHFSGRLMPCLHEAIAAIKQGIVQATCLRIVAAILIIKYKLDFWGLDGHNNVRFIAYGSQWLYWHKKENFQVAGASKQYNFQAKTHSTGYRPIATNSTN